MTDEERKIIDANNHQLQEYISGLYPEWRLLYVRGMKKMFDDCNSFYTDIAPPSFVLEDERRPIKLGLTHAALAETMQYIEDLFSIMYSTQEKPIRMGKIVNYGHGEIVKYITRFENKSEAEKLRALHMPYYSDDCNWQNMEAKAIYSHLKSNVLSHLKNIMEFRSKYRRFYTQYKHGLKIPLRQFGNNARGELCDTEIPIICYESLDISNKSFRDVERNSFILPNVHPDIALAASELYEQGDLLRYDVDFVNFDEILGIAFMTYQLLGCVYNNLFVLSGLTANDAERSVMFPQINDDTPFSVAKFPLDDEI